MYTGGTIEQHTIGFCNGAQVWLVVLAVVALAAVRNEGHRDVIANGNVAYSFANLFDDSSALMTDNSRVGPRDGTVDN